MVHPDMFIIHDLRNYPAMLHLPKALLNLLTGLGRKDGLFGSRIPILLSPLLPLAVPTRGS